MKNRKKIIGSISIVIIFSVFLIIGYLISRPSKEFTSKDVFNENAVVESKDVKDMTVYINGEVKKPGVYKLETDSRTEELIKIAGGFTEDADKDKLNLAKKLRDEDYIYVDKKSEVKNNQLIPQGNIGSGIGQNGKININTASKEELKTIPGVGDVTAQKILDYRDKNGRFSSIEDLKKLGGIGDKTLDKMKDKIEAR
jgi:competence protein ComEA